MAIYQRTTGRTAPTKRRSTPEASPYILFGNEEHADYHAPSDTFELIYLGYFYRSARTIADFVRLLDRGLDPVAAARAR
jgi:hypothetical protein